MSAEASPMPENSKPWLKSYPVDIDWNEDIPVKTMVELFDESIKKYSKRNCLHFLGRDISYKEVGEMVDKFAKGLQDQGIGKGSTVGICLPNTPYSVIAYYGAMKAGARVANFDPTSPAEALAQQINDSKTDVMVTTNLKVIQPNVDKALEISTLKKVIVCDFAQALPTVKKYAFRAINAVKGLLGKSHKLAKTIKDGKHLAFEEMMDNKGDFKVVVVDPSDVAVLQYTGGTTGVPKGAALTHLNLASNLQQAKLWFTGGKETDKQERMLAVLPFFHVFAMTVQMNLALHIGAELDMLPTPKDDKGNLDPTLEALSKRKHTIFAAVPALYKKMLEHKDIEKFDLSSIRLPLSGGAALPEKTMQRWKELIGSDIVEGYGLSETSPIVIANPINGVKKLGSIGMPLPKTEVKFTNIDFPDETVAIKMEGEICLRGPQIMKEYFGRPDETAKVFDKDGYFHTGDIGVMDEDGYVFITDRLKDMVIVNGFKAFPKKIEEAIRQHEDVSEVIVIGIADERSGETVKAFVQPKEGKTIDPEQLVAFLKDKLKDYEVPRAKNVEFRNTLPLTKIGKPDKKPLKEEEKKKAEARKNAPKP